MLDEPVPRPAQVTLGACVGVGVLLALRSGEPGGDNLLT